MAVKVVMAQAPHNKSDDTENPTFHDFFGSSSSSSAAAAGGGGGAGGGPVSATSDLASERKMENYFQGVPVHGQINQVSGLETSNRFLRRKRSNSDTNCMGVDRERIHEAGSEPLVSCHLTKMFRNSAEREPPRRSQDEELCSDMQPPNQMSTSHLHPPVGRQSDSVALKWEHSLIDVGASARYPSHSGQFATYFNKFSSKDSNTGPSIINPLAGDEGSRIGIKGSGILSATNGVERNVPAMLVSSRRPEHVPQSSTAPEPPDSLRRPGLDSASHQMTIFYAGQAHVFDEVHPNKADVIMSLAGCNGGSWSTTYSPKPSVPPLLSETYRDSGPSFSNVVSRQELPRKSIPGSSMHGFNQGGRKSTTAGDHLNTMSVRHTRPLNQLAEGNTKGKREV